MVATAADSTKLGISNQIMFFCVETWSNDDTSSEEVLQNSFYLNNWLLIEELSNGLTKYSCFSFGFRRLTSFLDTVGFVEFVGYDDNVLPYVQLLLLLLQCL